MQKGYPLELHNLDSSNIKRYFDEKNIYPNQFITQLMESKPRTVLAVV